MTTAEAAPPRAAAASRPPFDAVTIALHATTVVLVLGLFAVALAMSQARGVEALTLLTVHRSLGVTVWALTLGRLMWRLKWATVWPRRRANTGSTYFSSLSQ